MSKGEMLILVN